MVGVRAAAAQQRQWMDSPAGPIRIALNVSPRQFREPRFVKDTLEAFAACAVPASLFTIEITEQVVARRR